MPRRIIIPNGTEFGKLTVQHLAEKRGPPGQIYWTCLCKCGRLSDVMSGPLRDGRTRSCGKCPRESKSITHGMSYSPEHSVWSHIKGRCLTPTDAAYNNYGGRGITMFEDWVNDFMAFYNHVGPRPSPKHEIDRIDKLVV